MGSSGYLHTAIYRLKKITYKSYCKVNIGLQIHGQRPDGYNTIHTVFQELEFHDTIKIEKSDKICEFSCNVDWLRNDKSNLCVKAWQAIVDQFEIGGISINLKKRIPPGSGLGGGSSNAAAVLKGVSELYELELTDDKIQSISVALGADVPFFIKGGTQVGDGVGEILNELSKPIRGYYLLVIPPIQLDTAWAYSESKKSLDAFSKKPNFARLFREEVVPLVFFENDFESIVIPAYPEIGKIKETILAYGACYASLSGSGSTVFGIFDDKAKAKIAESVLAADFETIISYPTNSLL